MPRASGITAAQIAEKLEQVAAKYPPQLVPAQRRDIPRIAFHIEAAIAIAPARPLEELTICDLGGGIGLFSVGCAAVGFGHVVLVDDFGDAVNRASGNGQLQVHEQYGVKIFSRDIVEVGMAGLPEVLDVVTSFDSMEHWHHSPKRLFREVASRLAPGGGFLLGAPNNVNLRKRVSVPVGFGQWSAMHDWYEADRFRGHVREPNVADLRYIARDMGLVDVKIFGRNWLGLGAASGAVRWGTRCIDRPLQLFPSLCSDIYVSGRKSSTAGRSS